MTGARGRNPQHTTSDRRARDGALSLSLFALLFSVYLLTFSGRYHASDEISMLVATDSLARRGAWDIELIRWMGEQQGSFGPDGHLYSRKGIATTLAALGPYWIALQFARVGNVQAAMVTNSLVHALTGLLIYHFLRRLGYRPGPALGTALAYGLATMAWPYARYLFSESIAGLGLMASAYFLVCYGHPLHHPGHGQRKLTERQQWDLLLAGAGLGLALLARWNSLVVAPVLGGFLLVYLYQQFGRNLRAWIRPVVLFLLPIVASLAIAGWYNWQRFGSPLSTGYLPEERFATPFLEGLYGLTFSPGKGLFWYNPVLLAALVAWPAFFRRHRVEALLAGAMVASTVALYAPWYLWWGGHGWGPRFLVTILPLATLPLAPALEAVPRQRALAIGLGGLAAISVLVQILGVAVNFNQVLEEIYARLGLYDRATLFDPAYSPLVRQAAYLRRGNLDLAWARGGSIDWIALLTGLLLLGVSGAAVWAAWRAKGSVGARSGLLVLLGAGTAVTLVRYAPTGDVARATAELAAMELPAEAAALTDPLLTEAFQDAYDGHLWVWGVPSKAEVQAGQESTWAIGPGDPDPAAARFQVGTVRLDLYPPQGQPFDTNRLPVPSLEDSTRLGDVVELTAVRLEDTKVRRGEILPVVLYWRALAPMDRAYTVFVQVIEEQAVKAGQIDRQPCDGGCPTTAWRPGDVVGEQYDLPIDPGAAPGRYQLIAGMYDLITGERLPHLDDAGQVVGDYLPLGTIDVRP